MARRYTYACRFNEHIASKSTLARSLMDAMIHCRRPGEAGKP